MASACLPFLFRAVEIDGVPYWDGGYLGNPAIFPFFARRRPRTCWSCRSIRWTGCNAAHPPNHEPLNEITFNSSLMAEFRAIEFVNRLIDQGRLPHGTGRANIGASRSIGSRLTASERLSSGAKLTDFDLFDSLFTGGRRRRAVF